MIVCGCSELSVSEECDVISGECQCQEGAIGIKCDDCALGFTGKYKVKWILLC